eukprot:gene3137-30520_t
MSFILVCVTAVLGSDVILRSAQAGTYFREKAFDCVHEPCLVDFRVVQNGETYPSLPSWLKSEAAVLRGSGGNAKGASMWLVGKVPDAGLQSDTLIINANQPGQGDKGMVRTQFQLTRGIADGDTAAAAAAATVVTTQVFA